MPLEQNRSVKTICSDGKTDFLQVKKGKASEHDNIELQVQRHGLGSVKPSFTSVPRPLRYLEDDEAASGHGGHRAGRP